MTHTVAMLVFPGFQLLDIAGPLAVFEYAEHFYPGSYSCHLISAHGGAVVSSCGVPMLTRPLPCRPTFDTLMVSGGFGVSAACVDAQTVQWLRQVGARAPRVSSVCSGSLLLGASGVLDGRRATTHWGRSGEFRRLYPTVQLDADRIYVRDGNVWTSAGVTAAIDLSLAMVGTDLGKELASRVAKMLVVYHRRPGGDSQFSVLLELSQAGERFAPLLEYMRTHLTEKLAVADLAARACMGVRHFVRAFTAETGLPPSKAVERLRVDAARSALESGAGSIQQVARVCGFGQVERMRRSFLRQLGMPPGAVRAQVRSTADELASGRSSRR